LLAKTEAGEDPALTAGYPATWASRVRLTLSDGSVLEETVEQPKGMPANPLSEDELIAKFHDLADPVIGPRAASELVTAVKQLTADKPVANLVAPLSPRGLLI